jgi:hypothetical protein
MAVARTRRGKPDNPSGYSDATFSSLMKFGACAGYFNRNDPYFFTWDVMATSVGRRSIELAP